jgi:hypothetical protein
MSGVSNNRVIDRVDNVVLVDFRREPEPPTPRFPGATGVRALDPSAAAIPGAAFQQKRVC